MLVMKFGGAGLADAENIARVCSIVEQAVDLRPVVVASAMKGVTDRLLDWLAAAAAGESEANGHLDELKRIHENAVWELVDREDVRSKVLFNVNRRLLELERLFGSIACLREYSPKCRDYILSFGERFSTHLLAAALACRDVKATQVDGEDVVVTDDVFGNASPLLDATRQRARTTLMAVLDNRRVPVVMGFIGATTTGATATLGRGGSDLTAALVANCLDAEEVRFYKEVDGIMSADPDDVDGPRVLDRLSYDEVSELSFFGASILHPIAIRPLRDKAIPVTIRNFFKPEAPGTRICDVDDAGRRGPQAITALRRAALVTVEGGGIFGNQAIAGRVFSATAAAGVTVLMISQSSSEQSISFVVGRQDGRRTAELLEREFELELLKRHVETITTRDDCSVVSVVGAGLAGAPETPATIFGTLAAEGVEALLVVQGARAINLSFVIEERHLAVTLRRLHDALGMGQGGAA